jgi:HEAT repeat protein
MRKFLLMFSLLCVFLMFRLTTSQRASGFDFQQWLAGEEKAKAAFLRLSSSEQSAYIVPAFRAVYQRQVSLETLLPFFQSFREFTLREMIQVLSSFSPQSPFSIQKGENALQILGSLEPEALEALPFLLEVYPLLPLNLQHLVLELLEGWGSQAHRASLFVEERLSDPSLQIQEQGVLTLAEVDPENPKLFSSLLLVLKSGSEEKRKKAVYSLGKLKIATKREGERVSALLHALEDESPYVSLEALNALKVIPWDTENYFSSLVAFLQKEKWYVRKNTASLAAALKIKNLLPSLYQAIQEEQEQVFKKTKPEERFQHIRVFWSLSSGDFSDKS